MKRFTKKGFTLAELLVVVAIIAILVAVAIPTFNAAKDSSYVAVAEANARAAYGEYMVAKVSNTSATPKTVYTYISGNITTECTVAPVAGGSGSDCTVSVDLKDGTTNALTDKTFTFGDTTPPSP
jgi:type IV pilus assembly protein PilA